MENVRFLLPRVLPCLLGASVTLKSEERGCCWVNLWKRFSVVAAERKEPAGLMKPVPCTCRRVTVDLHVFN